MPIDLLGLTGKFKNNRDQEKPHAWFRTATPWVAPVAYLHIIYKPAAANLVSAMERKLRAPTCVGEFLRLHNGARLFNGEMAVYGVLPDIEQANLTWRVDPDQLLVIGSYRADGSKVCIDREGVKQTV